MSATGPGVVEDNGARARWIELSLFICGVLSALNQMARRQFVPLIHDEWAYLLQADTLLRGRLSLPAPALPEFFEAPHVLVTPVYAAKYYPGNALALAPFVALGVPWIWPCICLGASSVLLFKIARACRLSRAASLVSALCAIALPCFASTMSTYLAHGTTTLLYLGLLYYFLSVNRRPREWLFGGALIGMCLLTRPLDAAALCALASLLALREGAATSREKAMRLLALAVPTLCALGLTLLYNQRITGDWRVSPWALWARQYTPFDGMGIGPPSTAAPLRAVPKQIAMTAQIYWRSRVHYTWANFGHLLRGRIVDWLACIPSPLLLVLPAFGLFHLRATPRARWLLVLTTLLFLLQLGFHASLLQYQCSLLPGLFLLVGMGLDRTKAIWVHIDTSPRAALAAVLAASIGILLFTTYATTGDAFETSSPSDVEPISIAIVLLFGLIALVVACSPLGTAARVEKMVFAGFLLALALLSPIDIAKVRAHDLGTGYSANCFDNGMVTFHCVVTRGKLYESRIADVRAAHGLVFLAPNTNELSQEYPLINLGLGVDPDPPIVIAADLGQRNAELMQRYPHRPAFLLNGLLELSHIDPAGH